MLFSIVLPCLPPYANARAIPTAVRFVTTTYQSQLEDEAGQAGGEAADA